MALNTDDDRAFLFPTPKNNEYYELWALGKILILIGMLTPERRKVMFYRVEALLKVYGVI